MSQSGVAAGWLGTGYDEPPEDSLRVTTTRYRTTPSRPAVRPAWGTDVCLRTKLGVRSRAEVAAKVFAERYFDGFLASAAVTHEPAG